MPENVRGRKIIKSFMVLLYKLQKLQLPQKHFNHNQLKIFRNFKIQLKTPKMLTLCDLLTTNSAINSFAGLGCAKILEIIVEATLIEGVVR